MKAALGGVIRSTGSLISCPLTTLRNGRTSALSRYTLPELVFFRLTSGIVFLLLILQNASSHHASPCFLAAHVESLLAKRSDLQAGVPTCRALDFLHYMIKDYCLLARLCFTRSLKRMMNAAARNSKQAMLHAFIFPSMAVKAILRIAFTRKQHIQSVAGHVLDLSHDMGTLLALLFTARLVLHKYVHYKRSSSTSRHQSTNNYYNTLHENEYM